ncbi:hypothetical protein RLW55_03190 [Hyphomicrobium sp. B1]|uniref:hypothetical protein n=1 Tax=Hyphomicrobium sp. B1 TaxID=3075651 RepID=UPI003C2E4EC0
MDQASNDNTSARTTKTPAVHRRAALQLLASAPVAAAACSSTMATPALAETPTAIALHFAIWARRREKLRRLERTVDVCLRNYQSVAPRWPEALKFSEQNTGWRFYSRRCETVMRDDGQGNATRYLGSKAIAHAIDRLLRMADANAPIVLEAREALLLAKKIEDAEDEAGRLSSLDEFERELEAEATTVGDIGGAILAIEPKNAEDLRMQARVLRDADRGMPKDEATIRFLNFVMTSRFDI